MNHEVNHNRQVKTATDYCARVADGTHSSPKQTTIGKPLITSRHLKSGQIDFANAYKISELDFEEINRRSKVDQWDVLITMIGTVGEVCLVKDSRAEFAIKNVGLYKPKNKLDGQWLYYYLRSQLAQDEIKARTRGTTQGYISLAELRQFPILEPKDVEEKRQIVEILSSLDDKIELNRRMNATLEAMARALFKAWFVDFEPVHANKENRPSTSASPEIAKLFPSTFENGIPKGWAEKPFADFIDLINERVAARPAKDEERYIALDDMPSKSIDLSKHRKGSEVNSSIIRFRENDILFGSMRPYFHKVGVAPFSGITRTTTFVLRPKDLFVKSFALFHLFSDEVIEFSTTNSVGSTIPYVKWETLGRYKVPFPSNDILESFDGTVWNFVQRIFVNGCENNLLAELRDSLLPPLISGRLRIGQFGRQIGQVG